jgi:hypothetical protein
VKQVLASDARFSFLSRRGEEALQEARTEHDWLKPDASVLRWGKRDDENEWWTFAGRKANEQLSKLLSKNSALQNSTDNFSLRFTTSVVTENFVEVLDSLRAMSAEERIPTNDENPDELKFSECLPLSALRRMSQERQRSVRPVEFVLAQPLHVSSVTSNVSRRPATDATQ